MCQDPIWKTGIFLPRHGLCEYILTYVNLAFFTIETTGYSTVEGPPERV